VDDVFKDLENNVKSVDKLLININREQVKSKEFFMRRKI